MKKKLLVITALATAVLLSLNALHLMKRNDIALVSTRNVEALSQGDIQEVVILCGRTTGLCWRGYVWPVLTPLGVAINTYHCPEFTGCTEDFCFDPQSI